MSGFRLVQGPEPVIRKAYMTDDEDATKGEALKFSSGRLTKVTDGDDCAAIATHNVSGGTDKEIYYYIPTPEHVLEVEYTETPDGNFEAGQTSADVDSDALKIDASDVTGGAFSVVSVDTDNETCRVKVKGHALI